MECGAQSAKMDSLMKRRMLCASNWGIPLQAQESAMLTTAKGTGQYGWKTLPMPVMAMSYACQIVIPAAGESPVHTEMMSVLTAVSDCNNSKIISYQFYCHCVPGKYGSAGICNCIYLLYAYFL